MKYDVKISMKEDRDYNGEIIKDVYDVYPVIVSQGEGKPKKIVNLKTINDRKEGVIQEAYFAVNKQRGRDPMDLSGGVRWEESTIGEITPLQLMADIDEQAQRIGKGVSAKFKTVMVNGLPVLAAELEVL